MSALTQRLAAILSNSMLLRHGEELFQKNLKNWELPMTKLDKLHAGIWLILHDHANGIFPPTFPDQQKAYQAEVDCWSTVKTVAKERVEQYTLRKPFFYENSGQKCLVDFLKLVQCLKSLEIRPPARILELGCGGGWMSEQLAQMEFSVVGTTLSPDEIKVGQKRKAGLQAKTIQHQLEFIASPMECVHETLKDQPPFDVVFVYEALHHAFDWEKTIQSSYACLKKGGWLLLCNEPNLFHTFSSYRIARLTNTHEIGMSRKKLLQQMNKCGFSRTRDFQSALHCFIKPHWIAAQK